MTALATLLLARDRHLIEAAVEQRIAERAIFTKEVRQVTQGVHGQLLLTKVVVGVEIHVQVDANALKPVGRDIQHSGFHVDLDGPNVAEHVQKITNLLVPFWRGVNDEVVATSCFFCIQRREDFDGALGVPVVDDGIATPVGRDVLINQFQNGVDQLTTWDGIAVVVGVSKEAAATAAAEAATAAATAAALTTLLSTLTEGSAEVETRAVIEVGHGESEVTDVVDQRLIIAVKSAAAGHGQQAIANRIISTVFGGVSPIVDLLKDDAEGIFDLDRGHVN